MQMNTLPNWPTDTNDHEMQYDQTPSTINSNMHECHDLLRPTHGGNVFFEGEGEGVFDQTIVKRQKKGQNCSTQNKERDA